MVNKPVVHPKTEGASTNERQGDIVARQIDSLEAVYFLEMTQAIVLLVAIGKMLVHKMRDPPFSAAADRCRNKCICGSLVFVPNHRKNVHHACLSPGFVHYQLDEADHCVLVE